MKQLHILILEGKFVELGEISLVKDPTFGDCVKVNNCHNVRYYGTTKGLGQLAVQGKQPDTKLDYQGVTLIPKSKIIKVIEVTKEAAQTFLCHNN